MLSTVRPFGAGPGRRVALHREPILRLKQLFTVALQSRLWTTTPDFSGVGNKKPKVFPTTTALERLKGPSSVFARPYACLLKKIKPLLRPYRQITLQPEAVLPITFSSSRSQESQSEAFDTTQAASELWNHLIQLVRAVVLTELRPI